VTSFAALLEEPGVEERLILGSRVGFMAIHGGLEGGTDLIATRAAAACGGSLYTVVQPPTLLWHVPSHRVLPAASDRLAAFVAHVEVAISIHGYGRPQRRRDLLLGGRNRLLAAVLATELRRHLGDFTVVDDLELVPVEMRGVHAGNPVNAPAGHGVQLELPPLARGAVVGRRGDPCEPAPGLVDALAAAARRWLDGPPPSAG
jgi:phage replication-related protein YjqB (UPF0714/DUF867 family)